jgi:hypothetical protein
MNILINNSFKAERDRGLVFTESFKSINDVLMNNGTIVGNCLTNKKFNGNGSSYINYVNTYVNNGATKYTFLFRDVVSPTDVTTETAIMSSYDGVNGCMLEFAASRLYFFLTGSTGMYVPITANTLIGDVSVTYDGAGSGNAGKLKMYINGVLQTPTYVGTIGTSQLITKNIFVGTWPDLSHKLATGGSFSKLMLFNTTLTASEILAYYDKSIFRYEEKALVNLPMTMQTYDPTNKRTLDVSGNGNHMTFGDGSTTTTFPTKMPTKGFNFDGGDYMRSGTLVLDTTVPFTINAFVRKQLNVNYSKPLFFYANAAKNETGLFMSGNLTYDVYRNSLGSNVGGTPSFEYEVLTLLYDNSTTKLYQNGVLLYSVNPSYNNGAGDTANRLCIGTNGWNLTGLGAQFLDLKCFNFALSELQIKHLSNRLFDSIQEV